MTGWKTQLSSWVAQAHKREYFVQDSWAIVVAAAQFE
jgi:hypothetical protein